MKIHFRNGWKWPGMFSFTGHKWGFEILNISITKFQDMDCSPVLYLTILNLGVCIYKDDT